MFLSFFIYFDSQHVIYEPEEGVVSLDEKREFLSVEDK